eukprot:GHVT01061858.1.p1 GENE.GHVT01061858.1~~GHVT01061858.1.p1  ORF type:complete len:230 (-),score=47.19 GHVT01061858.1:1098-1787(-)
MFGHSLRLHRALPFDVAVRVWDQFFVKGDLVLFQASLGIISYYQELLEGGSLEEVMNVLSCHAATASDLILGDRFFDRVRSLRLTRRQVQAAMALGCEATKKSQEKRRETNDQTMPHGQGGGPSYITSKGTSSSNTDGNSSSSSWESAPPVGKGVYAKITDGENASLVSRSASGGGVVYGAAYPAVPLPTGTWGSPAGPPKRMSLPPHGRTAFRKPLTISRAKKKGRSP